MRKKALFMISLTIAVMYSCGPAAENRSEMHRRAQTISDSMANLIKVALQEAEMPGYQPPQPVPQNTAAPTATNAGAAPANTVR
jgi:hypothetical protein